MRVNLKVPFGDKEQVKQMGAIWDPARKVWFVPDGTDASKFLQWMPGMKLTKKIRRVLRRPV